MDDSDLMSAPTRKPLKNVPPPRDLGSLEQHLWNKKYHESDLKPLKEEVRVLVSVRLSLRVGVLLWFSILGCK